MRAELSTEFEEIESISAKLRSGEIHIAAFSAGWVSGNHRLLNALLQRRAFSTSPLHGETRQEDRVKWQSLRDGHVVLIDTPGIDELNGAEREQLARRISNRADIIVDALRRRPHGLPNSRRWSNSVQRSGLFCWY